MTEIMRVTCLKCNLDMEKFYSPRIVIINNKKYEIMENYFRCSKCGLEAGTKDTASDIQKQLKGLI